MLISPFEGVSWGLKESHSLFPSWGGLLVNGCCLTFTVCISLLELTWKLTAASRSPGFNLPLHVQLAKALTLSSSPSWPFSTALFNAHKSHTDRHWMLEKGIDRDIWLLVDNMHNWGVRKQVISLVLVCEWKTLTLVLCAHCCGSRPLFERIALIIQSYLNTHFENLIVQYFNSEKFNRSDVLKHSKISAIFGIFWLFAGYWKEYQSKVVFFYVAFTNSTKTSLENLSKKIMNETPKYKATSNTQKNAN